MPAQPEASESVERTPRENSANVCAQAKLDDRLVESRRPRSVAPRLKSARPAELEEMDVNFKDALSGLFGGRTRKT